MTSFCTIHGVNMPERSRVNDKGETEIWHSHNIDGKWCRGEGTGKAVRNGRFGANGKPLPQSQNESKPDWESIKSVESKKMMVMGAMKAASEVTKAMMDSGIYDQALNVDDEVIARMRKYVGEMEKLVVGG